MRSQVVCKFSCGRCNATYYGKRYQHLNVKVSEPSSAGKKSKKSTAVKGHMFSYGHIVSIKAFNFDNQYSDFHINFLKVKEMILKSSDEPI